MPKEKKPQITARVNRLIKDPASSLKAVCSVTIDDSFAVHGLKVVDSSNGIFVSMPGYSYKDGVGNTRYADYFHAVTKEAREDISGTVLSAYENTLRMSQDTPEEKPQELCIEDSEDMAIAM